MLTSMLAAALGQMDMKDTSINIPAIVASHNPADALPAVDMHWMNMEDEHFYFCQLKMGEVNVEKKGSKVVFVKVTSPMMKDRWDAAFSRLGLSTSGVKAEEKKTHTGGRMLYLRNVKGVPADMPVCWVPGSLYVGKALK